MHSFYTEIWIQEAQPVNMDNQNVCFGPNWSNQMVKYVPQHQARTVF